MVKAVSRYRAEGSQVILKSVTDPLNWKKEKVWKCATIKNNSSQFKRQNIQPKVPLLCNLSQGCHHTEGFESPVAPFSTPRAKLLLCGWILSRTGFFTCGMKGKWSILSRDRCYRPLMTALSLNHLSVVLICCRLMVLFTGLLIWGEFLCNKQHSEGTCQCRKRLSSISEEGWSLW